MEHRKDPLNLHDTACERAQRSHQSPHGHFSNLSWPRAFLVLEGIEVYGGDLVSHRQPAFAVMREEPGLTENWYEEQAREVDLSSSSTVGVQFAPSGRVGTVVTTRGQHTFTTKSKMINGSNARRSMPITHWPPSSRRAMRKTKFRTITTKYAPEELGGQFASTYLRSMNERT